MSLQKCIKRRARAKAGLARSIAAQAAYEKRKAAFLEACRLEAERRVVRTALEKGEALHRILEIVHRVTP